MITWSDDRGGSTLTESALQYHPDGMAATLAGIIAHEHAGAEITTAGLHEPHDGLPEALLGRADALIWWGHDAHEQVSDTTVDRVENAVSAGLGLVVLHSAHYSKIFRRMMGTSCDLQWRDDGSDRELIWTIEPDHPIAAGVESPIDLGVHEMYGEPFRIPHPDSVVFISSFTGGEVFRSGCCYTRDAGRVFYFSPGHETHPVYEHPQIRRVICNAVAWAGRRA